MTARIASLLPSATEIVCALGLGESLVARSHECDYPEFVERLPVCTASKIGDRRATHEIHAEVSAILQNDISVYRVESELLRQLAPTHIVTQVQCEVCAVSLRDVEAALADWDGGPPQIIPLNPQSLEDVFVDIRNVGRSLDCEDAADSLIHSMRIRMQEIERANAQRSNRPRMVAIEWIEPLMVAGNWMPTLVEMAGGIDVMSSADRPSAWITWEDLARVDPDIIVVCPCGFRIDDSMRDWHLLASNTVWNSLRAVREEHVFIADGNQYFNRPGPRLVESLEILAGIVQQCAG
ncbi:MAG TPA: cobalamin-binding protein [Thermoanaerobaculia bacterium]|nr:cobalamin-binding protein [Thermoanaerobaculia bacterium]